MEADKRHGWVSGWWVHRWSLTEDEAGFRVEAEEGGSPILAGLAAWIDGSCQQQPASYGSRSEGNQWLQADPLGRPWECEQLLQLPSFTSVNSCSSFSTQQELLLLIPFTLALGTVRTLPYLDNHGPSVLEALSPVLHQLPPSRAKSLWPSWLDSWVQHWGEQGSTKP